jgi:hypothetical protein
MQSETTALGTLLKYARCRGPLELTAAKPLAGLSLDRLQGVLR